MKKIMIIFIFLPLLLSGCWNKKNETGENGQKKGTITLSGAWALYPMAVKWAEEFMIIHPGIRIDISAGGAGKGMADVLSDAVDIGNISREIFPPEIEKGAWWVSVVKDAVVPTTNEVNPCLKNLLAQGFTMTEFRKIWISGEITGWDAPTGCNTLNKMNIYTRSDACGAAQTWAAYLGGNQEDLLGIGVYGDPGVAEAVKKDLYGIGYNNINYAYDSKSKMPVKGIKIIPLDLNNNDKIDPDEDFYNTRGEIIQAISSGVYPSPPARNLYFVCHRRPVKPIIRDFIYWVLTRGQEYINEAGYIPVGKNEIEKGLRKLNEQD